VLPLKQRQKCVPSSNGAINAYKTNYSGKPVHLLRQPDKIKFPVSYLLYIKELQSGKISANRVEIITS
jgi:hypothetical protein